MTTNEFISIEVNGQSLQASKGQMLIEVTDANGIYVPRFCYHKKLTVSASCRMCLVEVEKAPKPLPACATPVMDGMKVFTKSPLAIDAQKSVMEFLLINHPLDCPICDQGGECELQDLAVGYGGDVSRYQEKKRVVQDDNIGPLVQTDMTRCIHCTRCVRFGEEIAGMRELGGLGRGEFLQIGTYVEKSMASEMSANIIDLCPVGALTSKPFRFSARTWEMKQENGIAPHDGVGSNLHFHVKGNVVKRVVPAENENLNETWLSDRDRFSYEGLYSDDRLLSPMVKQGDEWKEVDWMTAFEVIKDRLGLILADAGANRIGALAAPTSTTEELYLLQKFIRGIGSNNIDHRLHQGDFSDQEEAPVFPWLGQSIADLEKLDAVLVVGTNVRKEHPIINHRLRKAALNGADIMMVNSVDYDFNYDLTTKSIVAPDQLVTNLAGIVKALVESGRSVDAESPGSLLDGIQSDAPARQMAEKLLNADRGAVLLGNDVSSSTQLSAIRYFAGIIAQLSGARLGYLGESANTAGAWLSGALPHRTSGGTPVATKGLHAGAMLEDKLAAYILFNVEPELDCWDGQKAMQALQAAQCVIAITPFKTSTMEEYADILLPIAQYAENEGSYINMEGVQQNFTAVVAAPGESRPGWKVLRVLGNTFELDGFDYHAMDEVANELQDVLNTLEPVNENAWRKPEAIDVSNGVMQRLTGLPMNSIDPLVRRAAALQETADIADGAVRINQHSAEQIGASADGILRVIQNGAELELPLVIDDRIPDGTVLIHAAHPGNHVLGPWSGEITIQPA